MSPDPDLRARFLAGMSHAAQTVNVVTTDGPAGRAGVTVSAMSSVSADTPRPTLLVCVHRDSNSAPKILENGVFCVNVLRDDQSFISDTFAGRFRDQVIDKFDCAKWQKMGTGAARVVDPLVAFDCRVVSSDLVGTHHVFFGEVQEIFVAATGSPLIYAKRAYGATAPIETPSSLQAGQSAARNQLKMACFYTISAFALPRLFARLTAEAPEIQVSLIEGDQPRLYAALGAGEVELALMYDADLTQGLSKELLAEREPYALLPADHPLATREEIAATDLASEPMVLLSTPPSPDYFLGLLRSEGVEPKVVWRSAMLETVRTMVANGLGFSLLASRPASDVAYDGKRVVARPLAWGAKPTRIMLVQRAGQRLSAAAERFAWLCREDFGVGLH